MVKSKQQRRSMEQMSVIIADWASGEESRQSYCHRVGLPLHVFNYWLGRLGVTTTSQIPVFREVKVPGGSDSAGFVRLIYPDGRVLEFWGDYGVQQLREVLGW